MFFPGLLDLQAAPSIEVGNIQVLPWAEYLDRLWGDGFKDHESFGQFGNT